MNGTATDFETLVQKLPGEFLQVFQLAVQQGHWPNGRKLTTRQRRVCMQAILLRTCCGACH